MQLNLKKKLQFVVILTCSVFSAWSIYQSREFELIEPVWATVIIAYFLILYIFLVSKNTLKSKKNFSYLHIVVIVLIVVFLDLIYIYVSIIVLALLYVTLSFLSYIRSKFDR